MFARLRTLLACLVAWLGALLTRRRVTVDSLSRELSAHSVEKGAQSITSSVEAAARAARGAVAETVWARLARSLGIPAGREEQARQVELVRGQQREACAAAGIPYTRGALMPSTRIRMPAAWAVAKTKLDKMAAKEREVEVDAADPARYVSVDTEQGKVEDPRDASLPSYSMARALVSKSARHGGEVTSPALRRKPAYELWKAVGAAVGRRGDVAEDSDHEQHGDDMV